MKILLVASPSPFTEQLKSAFSANDAELFYLNDRENYLLPSFLRNNKFIWRTTRRINPLRVRNTKLLGEKIISKALEIKPDLIFFSKALAVKGDVLIKLNSLGFKTANWIIDNVIREPYHKWFLDNYKLYNYFFIFDSGAKNMVKGDPESSRIFYLPLAIDPQVFIATEISDNERRKYSCDVCFVGALYPERERYLNVLKNLGIELKIYGWKGWENTSLKQYYYGPIGVKETVKLYRCAKICLNSNLEPAINGVNLKTFEIPAAGGFQLSDYRNDIEQLFIPGVEIDFFRDENELGQKVKYYLNNDELRQSIAEAGHQRVISDHTMIKRISSMLKVMAS